MDTQGVRDIKVRRFAQMPANRENPGVHHTARQSRDREGALADSVAGMRSLTVAARMGASQPSTFMSRARTQGRGAFVGTAFGGETTDNQLAGSGGGRGWTI